MGKRKTARDAPHNTCPASRFVAIAAEQLARRGNSFWVEQEPKRLGANMQSVVEDLWRARTALRKIQAAGPGSEAARIARAVWPHYGVFPEDLEAETAAALRNIDKESEHGGRHRNRDSGRSVEGVCLLHQLLRHRVWPRTGRAHPQATGADMSDTDIVMDGMKIVIGRMALAGDVDSVDRVKAGAVEIERLRASNAELVEAVKHVRELIAEGAIKGFNPHVGTWAERLFASQGLTRAALSRATKESDRG